MLLHIKPKMSLSIKIDSLKYKMQKSNHLDFRTQLFSFLIIFSLLLMVEASKPHQSSLTSPSFNLNAKSQALRLNDQQQSNTTSNETSRVSTTDKASYTSAKITRILNEFFEKGYDPRVRPNYGGPPVKVEVTMFIISISSVSEVMMDFTADFYFRQTWSDPRLQFVKSGNISLLFVGAEVSRKIWLPDTFFGNEKIAYFHDATTPNIFLRINYTGEIFRSIRLTVTSSCPMKLQYFPMDRQQCTIEAESYGYNIKDIQYSWNKRNNDLAVETSKSISLPQFDIIKTTEYSRIENLTSGSYSRLVAEIQFARRMGYYLIQIYIPSSLIVVISWVSFWLHRNASPARVQLGVTTVLTMTTLMSSTNAALPKISYVKSIDVFLGTCFVMVFAALIEYATVGYLGKRIAMRKAHAQNVLSHAVTMTQRMVAANQANLMSSMNHGGVLVNTQTAANHHVVLDNNHPQHQQHLQQSFAGGGGAANNPYGVIGGAKGAQPSVVEQFLNTAATLPNLTNTKLDKRAFSTGLRAVDSKLSKTKHLDSIFGVRPSSIDKYSRVVFPVCFVCFQLMYWIVYLHISAFLENNLENKH